MNITDLNAYLNHYDGYSYPVATTDIPLKGQTLSGYGSALPTRYLIQVNNRWRRVKCYQYSNAGTYYIGTLNKGHKVVTISKY